MPITSPAERALKICGGSPQNHIFCTWGVTKVRAKKPYTTVGMPASTSSVGLRMLRARRVAYSLR